jgi:hypothetical protein
MQTNPEMNTPVDDLVIIGKILALGSAASPELKTELEKRRERVPPPVLAHFLRSLSCGRRGVAVVRHGVCGECHLRIPSGTVQALFHPVDLHLCENCGCFLVLAAEEKEAQELRATVAPVRRAVGRPRRASADGVRSRPSPELLAV